MRHLPAIMLIMSISILFSCQQSAHSQQDNATTGNFQPEDVLQTVGGHQLKYKHIMAYVDMEMEGEDPGLLNNPEHMQALTVEAIEEFAEEPVKFHQRYGSAL